MAKKKAKEEAYAFHVYPKGTLSLNEVDLGQQADNDAYETELAGLQRRLFELGVETFQKGGRAVIGFEGWDAAGKGGVIRRLTALMDPRGFKVWPISAPRGTESRHHYLWRFWQRMPEHGEIGIFDRTWYGRVLVERVEGFAKPAEWKRAFDEINAFERMLTDDGVRMVKFWLQIDRDEQLRRFKDREKDPFKNYKIGPDDWRNRAKWKQYERAISEMLDRTHRPDAPWVLVPANDKKFARLFVLRHCVELLS